MKAFINFVVKNPAFVSSLAALVSLLFSIFIYFRTRHLLKQRERPMLLSEDTGQRGLDIYFSFKNWGEHPAQNVHIVYENARKGKSAKFETKSSKKFLNKIGPGQSNRLHFHRGGSEDLIMRFRISYEDAFTKKRFEEVIWLEYDSLLAAFREPTEEVIQTVLQNE